MQQEILDAFENIRLVIIDFINSCQLFVSMVGILTWIIFYVNAS